MYKRSAYDFFWAWMMRMAAGATIFCLVYIVGFVLLKGVPYLKPSLFALNYTSENVSLFPALVSTVMITVLSLIFAVPLGIFSAIYLVEYARRGNPAVAVIRTATETLSGIPSIVYGLFGLLCFVTFFGWSFSILSG